ncbi:MAG: phosphatase PAP2 family protein [Candidatus Paceibacterota bacterium]|jgi:undecaprenyl-diphosphatase
MNETIFYFFYNLAHQSVWLDKFIIFTAVYFPFAVVFLAGIFIIMHHEVFRSREPFKVFMQKKKEILEVFLSAFSAYFLAVILKLLIHTPRPFLALTNVKALFPETGFAFPSGHAAFFAALSISIFFSHKKAGYLFMFFAFLIGLARIMAGVHFPIDILGGFILGALVSYLVAYFVKKI